MYFYTLIGCIKRIGVPFTAIVNVATFELSHFLFVAFVSPKFVQL